jgi:hypothetical protein
MDPVARMPESEVVLKLECYLDNFVDLVFQRMSRAKAAKAGCYHLAGSHNPGRQVVSKLEYFPGSLPDLAGHCKKSVETVKVGRSPVVGLRWPSTLERRTLMPELDHMLQHGPLGHIQDFDVLNIQLEELPPLYESAEKMDNSIATVWVILHDLVMGNASECRQYLEPNCW